MISLLKYSGRNEFETAARYLQPVPERPNDLVQCARELQALHPKLKVNLSFLSNDPNGSVDPGLPPGQVHAGVISLGGTSTDVVLARVDDPDAGQIWLVSKDTVAKIPELYAQLETEGRKPLDRIAPAAISERHVLQMSLTQWAAWLLSIPMSWLVAWLLAHLVSMPRRIWCKLRNTSFTSVWHTPIGTPLKCIVALSVHSFLIYLLRPPLLYRHYYFRLMLVLLVASVGWLLSRAADQAFNRAVARTQTARTCGHSILILIQRLTGVLISILAVITALALLGLNMKTALAGLGIGGLAIALAAQKTLENLIGGVSLLMDKAVNVGDLCKIGNRIGTVEDIGLRSLKLRMLDQNLLVVPNGSLAQMEFENMSSRTKLLINQHFSLRIETDIEQLRLALALAKKMLDDDPEIERGTSRLRITSFAGAAFDLELFAYGKTGSVPELTAIQQEVVFKIAEIMAAAGIRIAGPTQLMYMASQADQDPDAVNGIVDPRQPAWTAQPGD